MSRSCLVWWFLLRVGSWWSYELFAANFLVVPSPQSSSELLCSLVESSVCSALLSEAWFRISTKSIISVSWVWSLRLLVKRVPFWWEMTCRTGTNSYCACNQSLMGELFRRRLLFWHLGLLVLGFLFLLLNIQLRLFHHLLALSLILRCLNHSGFLFRLRN